MIPGSIAANPIRSRDDVARLVRDLVDPVIPHFSPGRAQVRLGANLGHFGDKAGWLEGYARPLWGLVPLAAGGGAFDHWKLWQEGLASGVDPDHSESWGMAGDYDQRSVEQAAFALALAMAPEKLWDPLTEKTRGQLAAWLDRINRVQVVRSNWLFFRVLVNLALRLRGVAWEEKQVAEDFALVDSFHLGGGWYTDGDPGGHHRDGRTGDYYIPMAFQYYGLLYAGLAGGLDPERAAIFRERAVPFARDFQYWFDADGSALPFGRSLAYRFAQGAFWGALAYAGVEALPWPVIKGLYMRHLRWWMSRPIFSESGLLTIGYAYPNLLMAESYNSPCSPYWALKAFLPLALPEDHPFWTAEEAPLPPRRSVHTVPGANLILVTGKQGDVTAVNPGQPCLDWPRTAPHKYSKCAYSTRFGFSVPAGASTPEEGGFDSDLALSEEGRHYRRRDFAEEASVREGVAYSRWNPWPDVEVTTWLVADSSGHVRIHRLKTGRPLHSLESGFAVCWTNREHLRTAPGEIITPHGVSTIRNLYHDREAGSVDLGANTHLLGSLATMPVLRSRHEPGIHWLACRVEATPDGAKSAAEAGEVFATEERLPVLLHEGKEWWRGEESGCGHSSPERLAGLDRITTSP